MAESEVVHKGGCHCGAVRFEVTGPAVLQAVICNCSICHKKQNNHFIVPETKFHLLHGDDSLTKYTFNTHQAQHLFCKHCGVQSFYRPRSNPDGVGVMPHCLDQGTVKEIIWEHFDGHHWKSSIKSSDIPDRSKLESNTKPVLE